MNTEILQDLKPFEQRPYWNPDAEFTISGSELERLYNALSPFIGIGFILQRVLEQGIQEHKVQVKYEYLDGSGEVSQEDVQKYTAAFMELMQQRKEADAANAEEDVKPLNSKKIITEI